MLRGTVYLVFDPPGEVNQRIARYVTAFGDVFEEDEFKRRARMAFLEHDVHVLEFGPIAPAWSR